MRARFIGNGKDDPAGVTLGGVYFPLHGAAMDVPAEWQDRVSHNNHFVVDVKRKPGRPRRGEDRT